MTIPSPVQSAPADFCSHLPVPGAGPRPPLTRFELQLAINAADLAGATHYAAGLRQLYEKLFSFRIVTGRDFGRSIAWAKAQPTGPLSNAALRQHVREHKQRTDSRS